MPEPKPVEELYLQQQSINMRLLINRSHGHMRFMDFRVGNYERKRDTLDETARCEGMRKIFTLVEKQDSKNWHGVGFTREGVYPSFFRTADAYVMCRHYNETGDPLPSQKAGKRVDDEDYPKVPLKKPDRLRVTEIKEDTRKAALMDKFNGHFKALPFGRVTTPDLVIKATARKKEGWACAEIDDSYGHAMVGFYPAPNARGPHLGAQALVSLLDVLDKRGVANLFGLAAATDELSNGLFSQLDFRITGRLQDHLQTPKGASTALLWHRRIASGRR